MKRIMLTILAACSFSTMALAEMDTLEQRETIKAEAAEISFDCTKKAFIKQVSELAIFTDLTSAKVFSDAHSGKLIELLPVDGQQSYMVQYLQSVVEDELADGC